MKKFNFIFGNPPFDNGRSGGNADYQAPVYPKFREAVQDLGITVELIHPSRILFPGNPVLDQYTTRLLNDPHVKVLFYEPDGRKVFPNVELKGGAAITYRNAGRSDIGPILVFAGHEELSTILRKVTDIGYASIMDLIYIQLKFSLEKLFASYPETRNNIGSGGRDARLEKNIFEKVPQVFSDEPRNPDDIKVLGTDGDNRRAWKFVSRDVIDTTHPNLDLYKVVVACTNGSGALDEVLSSPLVMEPGESFTRSFISFGAFQSRSEANAALKYIKTKFARAMLHLLKTTQMNNRPTWKYVPSQDFSSGGDLDWSQSVAEIDQQLYKKYGLSEEEIEFIESHVKEMV